MDVTDSGIVIDVNFLQDEKASSPMDCTECGIPISLNAELENALFPMAVSEFGRMILVKDSQLKKVVSSMVVTKSGILIVVSEVQRPKALLPILLIDGGIERVARELQ